MDIATPILMLAAAFQQPVTGLDRQQAEARAALRSGDLVRADRLLGELVETCARIDPTVRQCTGFLLDHADVLKRIGAPRRSERQARRALAVIERGKRAGGRDAFEALNFIAMALEDQGNPKAAEAYHRRAGEVLGRMSPRDPKLEALHLANMASNMGFQERHMEAEAIQREVLRREEALKPRNEAAIAMVMVNLGQSLLAQGRLRDAEPYLVSGAGNARGLLTAADPELARGDLALAELRRAQRRYAEAADHYRRALSVLERYGDHHGLVAVLGNIGLMLNNQDSDGGLYFRRAYEMARRIQGAEGVAVAEAAQALAYNEGRNGRRQEARALLLEAYRIRAGRLGLEDGRRIWGAWWLGATSETWDRNPAEARVLYRQAIAGATERINTYRDFSAQAQGEMRNFGVLYRAQLRVAWTLAAQSRRP